MQQFMVVLCSYVHESPFHITNSIFANNSATGGGVAYTISLEFSIESFGSSFYGYIERLALEELMLHKCY